MKSTPPPLPVLVIGGYLGAGKTTLLNHLLRHANGNRLAVLVNDFGDIEIDAALIRANAPGSSEGVISLAGGCLCCSFGDDLVGTLSQLALRQPALDMALIELSGVALPASVTRTVQLAAGVANAGTLVLADTAALPRQATDPYVGETVRQQLQQADWVLLNKPDLCSQQQIAASQSWLQAELPQVRVVCAAVESLPIECVLGWLETRSEADAHAPAPAPAGLFTRLSEAAQADSLNSPSLRQRSGHAASSIFESLSLPLPASCDLQALGRALADPDSGVLRAKGLLPGGPGGTQLLQVAAGRWQISDGDWEAPAQIVLIGLRGFSERLAQQAWFSALGGQTTRRPEHPSKSQGSAGAEPA